VKLAPSFPSSSPVILRSNLGQVVTFLLFPFVPSSLIETVNEVIVPSALSPMLHSLFLCPSFLSLPTMKINSFSFSPQDFIPPLLPEECSELFLFPVPYLSISLPF